MTTPTISAQPPANDANNNSSTTNKLSRRQKSEVQNQPEEEERHLPHLVFDPDSAIVCYWTAAVALVTLYNAWTIALRIAFPEMRLKDDESYFPSADSLCDLVYWLDILIQLRTAYLQDGIPVFDTKKIRQHYVSQTYFIQDIICVLPSHTILSLLPNGVEFCKYFLCSAGAARLTKLLKFHILYKFYNLAESFTSNPHLIRVLRLFLNLTIIIHWIACLYYLLSEYEGLGSNDWVYTNATDQQRFSRKYLKCLYWSAMTLTTIGDTNTPETDLEYIFTGVIFLTGVFVFATVMGNVGDVISSMNANRQEFQARMDHIQMYLTHKKVPASLQLKIKKWAEYTWSRTKATDESRLLNMLPERLRAEVAVHVHLDSLKKVKIFEQCETGFLCELVLKLRSQVFSPGDYVCRVGETGREMFIINHGKVEVIVSNPSTNKPMVVAVLSEGNYFGEISLLRLDGVQNSSFFNRRTADVRSIGYSELLCLSRRDLMAALVEYPEAKSVLEDQAKKRMKTNLQAQRAFSVDALLRSSQEQSSTDSGIVKDELIGHDVSEIKAMIEELKNANKGPGRSVWQMIAKCEVLQAKLSEKEKEVEDSKQRIRDLENLLYSRHYAKQDDEDFDIDEAEPLSPTIRGNANKVTKQYSQDEGRQNYDDRRMPDLKVTPSSEAGSSSDDSPTSSANNNYIRTSKITNIFEKPSNKPRSSGWRLPQLTSSEILIEDTDDNFQVENVWNYNYGGDNEITFESSQQISMTTSYRDEFHLGDELDMKVHTIPEENEESINAAEGEEEMVHFSRNENLMADARPLSFQNCASRTGRVVSNLDNVLEASSGFETQKLDLKSLWKRPSSTNDADASGDKKKSMSYSKYDNVLEASSGFETQKLDLKSLWKRPSSTNGADASSKHRPNSTSRWKHFGNGTETQQKSRSVNGVVKRPASPDEVFEQVPSLGVDTFDTELSAKKEQDAPPSSAQEIKRLLDGQASKSFKCVNGMDFLRMASMRSRHSDDLGSRRSSFARSDEDYGSSDDDYGSS